MSMKKKNAAMAVEWQKLCAESYAYARFHADQGNEYLASFYQRQAAFEHRSMQHFLFTAIACRDNAS